ncbi:sulfatase-like hydrolase/transferase [Neobacillus kokaensis]|uniref:Choline-sulfatase n=1 Tax=Neobacillus kokaensis TaxID=2759023 RepID=A0ABQ3N6N2_9BACI|nr:sulfatase-like hydrolase/transferase [Neobacillus kokaensis]GHH99814.1 choline-sulfatase [Neobacillus kokaensis]
MTKQQPNIVFITCDHLRADHLGCAGHPIIQTPHIDQLARNGVRFENAYSATPICIPARASIMTGMEGHSLGLTTFKKGFELPVKETLPQLLKDQGYQTKVVGKMHVFPERCHYGFETMLLCEEGARFGDYLGENRGYDDYEQWLAEQGYAGMAFSHGISVNEYATTIWNLPDHLHPTEWIGTNACKEIRRRDWTRPLFLWASFTAPHPPLTPLMKDLYMYQQDEIPMPVYGDWSQDHPSFHALNLSFGEGKTDKQIALARQAYYASVTQIDRQVNRIIGTLREQGILENTWFIFTSDHGDNLGDHHLWQKANFLQGACNIPFIITPPLSGDYDQVFHTNWLPGKVSEAVVGLQDILPTCLEIAKGYAPEQVDGKSLIPIVIEPKESIRNTILGEFGHVGQRSLMLTDGYWKYIWYEEDGVELLFNLREDPNEIKNLSGLETHVLKDWRGRLVKVLAERFADPATDGKTLRASAQGYKVSKKELTKVINTEWPYSHPYGLR